MTLIHNQTIQLQNSSQINNQTIRILIPLEIINKILTFIGELKNDISILQYNIITNKIYFKLNYYSESLWKIKSVM